MKFENKLNKRNSKLGTFILLYILIMVLLILFTIVYSIFLNLLGVNVYIMSVLIGIFVPLTLILLGLCIGGIIEKIKGKTGDNSQEIIFFYMD